MPLHDSSQRFLLLSKLGNSLQSRVTQPCLVGFLLAALRRNGNEGKLCRKQWKGMSLLSTSLSSFHNWFGCAQQLVHRAAAFTGSTCPPAFADLVSNTSAILYNKGLTAFSWDGASPSSAQQRGIMYPHEFVDLCFATYIHIWGRIILDNKVKDGGGTTVYHLK